MAKNVQISRKLWEKLQREYGQFGKGYDVKTFEEMVEQFLWDSLGEESRD